MDNDDTWTFPSETGIFPAPIRSYSTLNSAGGYSHTLVFESPYNKEKRMNNRTKAVLLQAKAMPGFSVEDTEILVEIIEDGEWDELLARVVVYIVAKHPYLLESWRCE